MKFNIRHIVFLLMLMLAQWVSAGTKLISNDPNWLGGRATFNTTEGNDFWLTFMNNGMFNPSDQKNASIQFEMKIAVSAREDMDIIIAADNSTKTLTLNAGETKIYDLDRSLAQTLYLYTSEDANYKGVHVYAAQKDKDKFFSCFLYNRAFDSPNTSRDASLVIPSRLLGKEYIIQTYPQDVYSSEFAIVATEDNTTVNITPTFDTDGGKAKNKEFSVTLSRGQAYLVASKKHEEGSKDLSADLTGSRVCADKPIAVFNGNQQTGIPNREGTSQDFLIEQVIPVSQWGTEFYLSKLANTVSNYAHITALEDGTDIQIYVGNTSSSIRLDRGKTQTIQLKNANEVIIKAEKPLICYDYTTTAAENNICTTVGFEEECYMYGDPSNAMMPAWKHHTKSMTFYTDSLDPQGGASIQQHFYVYVVTKTNDIGKFTLNGTPVASSSFSKFQADATMAYAHINLPDATERSYHLLETTGEGFVGMVYGITQAQAYFYTLGFTPTPEGDSLFINNTEALMSSKSYDLDSLDGHGWYQRQWDEWVEGKERLDTAVVCDSSTVYWTLETHPDRPVEKIEWTLYDLTSDEDNKDERYPKKGVIDKSGDKHKLEHQFILPFDPDMKNRKQFYEYELEIITTRNQILCGGVELDTFRTVTRVTRIFNDTIWRAICVGDTLPFFKDSLYNQADQTQYKTKASDSTLFIATKATEGYPGIEWNYNVKPGKYTFPRRYLSQFGCDSLITLELFVCDTFRTVDTVHLCSNDSIHYHGAIYCGEKYTGNRRGVTEVTDKESIQEVKFKTTFCGCQTDEKNKTKYKDKYNQPFEGCDSIFELHLYMHPSYSIDVTDTLDYKEYPDSVYRWKIERNGVTRDSLISLSTKTLSGDSALKWNRYIRAWVGDFTDTLRTKTCNECQPKGCDSINSLKLYIPPVYHYEEDTVWCRIHYDWNDHDTTFQDFKWFGHHHDTVYTEGGDYYDSCVSQFGADSIYHLHLTYSQAKKPIYDLIQVTVCYDTIERTRNWTSRDGVINVDTIRQDTVGHFYYVDESRCDSIYALELTVLPTYYFETDTLISLEQTYKWYANDKTYGGPNSTGADSIVYNSESIILHKRKTTPVNGESCDSIHALILHMGEVYRDTVHKYVCEEETQYFWTEDRPKYYVDGKSFDRDTITSFPARGEHRLYQNPYKTALGFDSIFYLDLYRAPAHDSIDSIRVCQSPGATFDWPRHGSGHKIYDAGGKEVTSIPAERYGDYWYIDSLETTGYGCDSIWHLHLYVDSVYHSDSAYKTCQFADYEFPYQDPNAIYDKNDNKVKPIPTEHVGDYTYYAKYKTVHGCDSTFTLSLHIDTVYKTAVTITDTAMCDKDSIVFVDRTIYGSNSPNKPADADPQNVVTIPDGQDSVIVALKGSVLSSLGCDSAVEYSLTVFKTYSYTTYLRLCQPSEGRDSFYVWSEHDTVWDVHNQRFIPADSIPRFVKGDTTYLYIDSLRTKFCSLCNQGRGGCDSLFFLYLTIDSTYHFDSIRHICENERVTWQGRTYAGDQASGITPSERVLTPGIYRDTAKWEAAHSCDSIYYLELHVHPIYHYKDTVQVCDSEREHTFLFSDTWGTSYTDPISFDPHPTVNEKDTSTTYYEVRYETREHMLKSIDGCDSLVTLTLAIHPTYRFVSRGKGCFGDIVEWRGKYYSSSGIYYDSLKTDVWGCDSVFVLEFLIKPVSIIPITDTICESESYVHRDTLWGAYGEFTVFEEQIWEPGNPRPRPNIDVHILAKDGCDSIIYRYNITVCDTFTYYANAGTICSGDTFYSEELNHAWEKAAYDYDTDRYVLPYDTIFVDSLQTVMGCDSLYFLFAHVLPSYRHVVYDTICENETYTFRGMPFLPTSFGDTIVRDSLYTSEFGCDSIYELRLSVYPKFYDEQFDTICADETYLWRDSLYKDIPSGDNLLTDSLKSHNGCDSVYHMYLYVKDTTYEVRPETICIGDTLTITETGHIYTVAGDYKDTTLNDEGCHHFIYTHLDVIPPTVPTVWAENPMCQDTTAFDLYYTYTSHYPIAYSLYFDSIGKSMGFEDMEDIAITEYTDPMVITVPIPYRDDERTNYPRPDNYAIRLVLDNGICQHKETDCYDDSTFMMSYPFWLTEQRHGDVIALLNDKYNGGYTWSSYQWYHGDQLLVGQTNPYLYIPTGLVYGDQYHVELTRKGETESFPTCPITISYAPYNDYAPTKGYLDVVPTCVTAGHPYITIMSRHDGNYRITTSEGSEVSSGNFHADATEVGVPSVSGMYIVQLWSEETKDEPYRAIKIVVRDICETCATSF